MTTEPKNSTTILVTDDDKYMRESIKELLALHDMECTLAEDGQQALEMLAVKHFDIVIIDLVMPRVGGKEVMHEINKHYADTDFVVASAEASFHNAKHALQLGAHDFLSKPYNPDELIFVIKQIMEKQHLKSELRKAESQIICAEKKYRFFVQNSPDIIYMLDNKGHIMYINPRIEDLLGYKVEEVVGKHFSTIMDSRDVKKAESIFHKNIDYPELSQTYEFKMLPKGNALKPRCFISHSIAIRLNEPELLNAKPLDIDGFTGIYGVARDITDQKNSEQQIRFQLYHDMLTRLPNRILFKERIDFALSQARRNQNKFAVLYLDMDRFKVVNDTLGHIAGDKLLQAVATRLKSCLRDSDTLARVGGDEFNLLMHNVRHKDDILNVIKKITRTLDCPFSIEKQDIFVSLSIGVAVYPEDGKDSDTLIKSADMAMYYVKRGHFTSYEFFSKHMKETFQQHIPIERGIRQALVEGQFEVYFQPQFDIRNNRVTGIESLIRWIHPDKGMILPGDFISLAEETGLIADIGKWVIDASCKSFKNWKESPDLKNIILSINISALQLVKPDFVDYILCMLEKYDLNGEQLELEITENVLMQDMDLIIDKFQQLSVHGVRFAVDDFGIGYSSLNYLHVLPLNTLKIDQSFIATIKTAQDRNSIITAIIAMAKEMDMNIVAEGIETQIQLDYIFKAGCAIAQGFYLSRPLPASETRVFALENNAKTACA